MRDPDKMSRKELVSEYRHLVREQDEYEATIAAAIERIAELEQENDSLVEANNEWAKNHSRLVSQNAQLRQVIESVRNLCAGSITVSVGSINSHHEVLVPVGMVDEMTAALSSAPENPYTALRPELAWFVGRMEAKLR